MASLKLETS